MFAHNAFYKLLDNFEFNTVLDIGCGSGEHSGIFKERGKKITSIDYGRSVYYDKNQDKESVIQDNFLDFCFLSKFDCVWASHVLEHQLNVNSFLKKIFYVCEKDGIIAITVPVFYGIMEGGHLTAWNAGLLLYNMVLAGFDCRDAHVLTEGYDISVIVRKRGATLPELDYDYGDITRLKEFLPDILTEGYTGNIQSLNWWEDKNSDD